jgi:carbamoyl-phosphate synthase large subunit
MRKIGLECPRADVAESMEHALEIQARFGFQ